MRPEDATTELRRALPIRDVHVRVGVHSNCGGIARALVDLEEAPAFELADAVPPVGDEGWADQELVGVCVTAVGEGVEAELRDLFGGEPSAVRVVVRAVHPHLVEANESINRRAGRAAAREAVRRAGLAEALAVPEPTPGERFPPS